MPDRRKVSRAAIAHSGNFHASPFKGIASRRAVAKARGWGRVCGGEGSDASEAVKDSAPYEELRTQPTIDAEARQAERSRLSKRERRNEVRNGRDRACSDQTRSNDYATGRAVSAHGGFPTESNDTRG